MEKKTTYDRDSHAIASGTLQFCSQSMGLRARNIQYLGSNAGSLSDLLHHLDHKRAILQW